MRRQLDGLLWGGMIPNHKLRVLVVADDAGTNRSLSSPLVRRGFDISHATAPMCLSGGGMTDIEAAAEPGEN